MPPGEFPSTIAKASQLKKNPLATKPSMSAWAAERPPKQPEYFKNLREGNMPSSQGMNSGSKVNLPVDIRRQVEKIYGCHHGGDGRGRNAMWNILLATEEAAKTLERIFLTTNILRLETEYTGTKKSRAVHIYHQRPFGGLLLGLRSRGWVVLYQV